MNRCTQLDGTNMNSQPLEHYLILRSSVKGQGHMSFLVFSVCVCGYAWAVLSLGQGLMILLTLGALCSSVASCKSFIIRLSYDRKKMVLFIETACI